jgi:hypothetical protein
VRSAKSKIAQKKIGVMQIFAQIFISYFNEHGTI